MRVEQISVFLENKSGRLAKVTQVLGEKGINIRALSIADTSDFGILRLIVSNPKEAFGALKEAGFTLSTTEVIAVEMSDQPGGLAQVLAVLEEASVNIEYLYAFSKKASQDALVVFRVEQLDRAVEVLQAKGITVLSGETVYSL